MRVSGKDVNGPAYEAKVREVFRAAVERYYATGDNGVYADFDALMDAIDDPRVERQIGSNLERDDPTYGLTEESVRRYYGETA